MSEFRNTVQPDWDWWSELWPNPEGTLRELGIDGCESLVALACGNGYFAVPAARLAGTVYAVDIHADLLEELRAYADREGVEVTTVEGDAMALPELVPESVECVLLAHVLHGVSDEPALAATVRDALVDGGRFLVVNWHDYPSEETTVLGEERGPPEKLRMSPEETKRVVEPAGFDAVGTVELEPYHYGVVFEKRG